MIPRLIDRARELVGYRLGYMPTRSMWKEAQQILGALLDLVTRQEAAIARLQAQVDQLKKGQP